MEEIQGKEGREGKEKRTILGKSVIDSTTDVGHDLDPVVRHERIDEPLEEKYKIKKKRRLNRRGNKARGRGKKEKDTKSENDERYRKLGNF
jgi:hypothetical protein